jgi:hypothetical protein
VQFWNYMKNIILHGNLGYSYYYNDPVGGLIANRLPATLSLTVGAAFLWIVVGVPVGIISAIKRRTLLDRAAMGTALVLRLGAGILARPDRALPLRQRHRPVPDLPRRRQLRRPHESTRGNGSPRCCCRGSCSRRARRDLRAADARQPAAR